MKVVFIGAGNVATHLSLAIRQAGFTIAQIYSRNEKSVVPLADKLQTNWTTDTNNIVKDADIYIFSLKDDALESIITQIPANPGCWIHTAGSIPMDIFDGHVSRYGVLYPLQTFSKNRAIDFTQIPCFIEANSSSDEELIYNIASCISTDVRILPSEKRKYLHLAAVFACNFTNYMYTLAEKILEDHNIPGETIIPLIDETAAKIHSLTPAQAQTGPAIRYDQHVIRKHLDLLKNPDMKDIYQIISKSIHKAYIHE